MMTDEALAAALEALPGERVTPEYMKNRIAKVRHRRIGGTLTHCTIYLDNGFSVSGESACVDPINYQAEIGERIAYDQAFLKLWPLFGFLLAEARAHREKTATEAR
jgi:hypothetical protein